MYIYIKPEKSKKKEAFKTWKMMGRWGVGSDENDVSHDDSDLPFFARIVGMDLTEAEKASNTLSIAIDANNDRHGWYQFSRE